MSARVLHATAKELEGYVTFRGLAQHLDYRGKRAAGAARKWVLRNRVPKKWRGGAWVVRLADVERVLNGETLNRGAAA